DCEIIWVEPHKLGPNYAILAASEFLNDEPVFVSYCDFNLRWSEADFLKKVAELKPASASICYKGFHPHLLGPNLYAGVRADDKMFALEVKEKHSFTEDKMDTWQQTGLFWFSSGEMLKEYCERALGTHLKTLPGRDMGQFSGSSRSKDEGVSTVIHQVRSDAEISEIGPYPSGLRMFSRFTSSLLGAVAKATNLLVASCKPRKPPATRFGRGLEMGSRESWTLNGESYTSLLFNPMIADGLKSLVYPVEHFCQWGTPEDLEEYEAWSRFFAREAGRDMGKTDIPESREKNVKINLNPESVEYKKSYDYWKKYFEVS
ncbi:MAG: hypothetical protein Q7S36_01590, partial [Candidatus Liptonbacteria bacterium]|nr:hypothetical protein [Candidatus Liptonbacteria bacterium]